MVARRASRKLEAALAAKQEEHQMALATQEELHARALEARDEKHRKQLAAARASRIPLDADFSNFTTPAKGVIPTTTGTPADVG